jgi:hypothetical protein
MQQRQLRLGDILDDYCPRERRITNHAVVAMVGQEVKRTRCTTCEAEHEYKHAKLPPGRRKKDTTAAAFSEVLAAVQQDATAGVIRPVVPEPEPEPPVVESMAEPAVEEPAGEAAPVAAAEAEPPPQDEGPVHRRLIRATLPRTDAPVARPVPQFTMHEPPPRGGHFRAKGGHRPHHGAGRPQGRQAGDRHPGGSRKGGFGPHPRPSRPGHGSHPSRPGKKHSR